MKNGISLLLAAVVVLTLCQPSQAGAKRDPKPDINECVASARAWELTFKHDMALFMGVSQERMPALFCQRLADGVSSGRISYSDINNLQLDQPTEIWMVLKGKSKPAPTTQAPAQRNFRTCKGVTGTFQVAASRKCPLSGHANIDQPTIKDRVAKSTRAAAPRTSKFRTCKGLEGTFDVPVSRKCPLSGYAQN